MKNDMDQLQNRCKRALDKFIGEPVSHQIIEDIYSAIYVEVLHFILVNHVNRETLH